MMRKFKFLLDNETRQQHNGVTNSFLIELSEEILSYSDWIYSSMLTIDPNRNQDSLIIEFMDINGDHYDCQIFEDQSFQVNQKFEEEPYYMDTVRFDEAITSDYNNLINYLKTMPKTFANFF
jgi:hypothetical protein